MRVPNGPFENPSLKDGIYSATVVSVSEGTYGPEHETYLSVLFELDGSGEYFVTNFYFPTGRSIRSEQRLSVFCGLIGTDKYELQNEPQRLAGRRLRLEIVSCTKPSINYGRNYCDVLRFLPCDHGIVEPSAAHGDQACDRVMRRTRQRSLM